MIIVLQWNKMKRCRWVPSQQKHYFGSCAVFSIIIRTYSLPLPFNIIKTCYVSHSVPTTMARHVFHSRAYMTYWCFTTIYSLSGKNEEIINEEQVAAWCNAPPKKRHDKKASRRNTEGEQYNTILLKRGLKTT